MKTLGKASNGERWIVLVSLSLLASIARAEGNCPPGYYPIGAPQGQAGPQSCAPIPGYRHNQQQQSTPPPQPIWSSRWGAIVIDDINGVLGVSKDRTAKNEAVQAAIADCLSKGGSDKCHLKVSYDNECAAVAVGDAGYEVVADPKLDKAIQGAVESCGAGTTNCHVYYSACSLPVQIQ